MGDKGNNSTFHLSGLLHLQSSLMCLCNLIFTVPHWGRWNCYLHFPRGKKKRMWIDLSITWPYLSFWNHYQVFCLQQRPREWVLFLSVIPASLVRVDIPIGKHSGSHMAHKCMTPSTHIFTVEDQGACWKECSFHSQRNWFWFPDCAPSSAVRLWLSCGTPLSLPVFTDELGIMITRNPHVCCEDWTK